MSKAIFWIIIFIGGLFATRVLARKAVQHALDAQRVKDEQRAFEQNRPNDALKTAEKMVRCEYCSLHLPSSEAIVSENHIWCSKEHAKLGAAQHA
jgi:uncharacterized protein